MSKYHTGHFLSCFVVLISFFIFTVFSFDAMAENPQENTVKIGVTAQKSAVDPTQTTTPARANGDSNGQEEEKTGVEEEQDLMEKALELLEIADNYWKNSDLENTLDTLDKAYALLLDTDGDVEIARQKDDLRLLISRRILALYSSRQARTNGKASEIPYLMNADVEKEIRSFQGYEREFFISSYQRSGMYKDIIIPELRKAGVPEELFWLPLVESGFKASALSRARALGLWQFIPSTGYKFGLTRDEWVDERMDVLKSTHAAIAYLKELHAMFGDWLTVLAAYNCGEGRVLRVISRQHINYFDRFWDLYSQLPNETARYVPRFLATLHIIKNPAKYGFDLGVPNNSLANYEVVLVNKMMKLSDVASKLEVSEDVIHLLNAELRYKITPGREYALKIPRSSLQQFQLVYNDIPETDKPRFSYNRSDYIRHRVRSGETVSSIAKRYRVSSKAINACNPVVRKKKLRKGQIVRIPVYRAESAVVKQTASAGKKKSESGGIQTYKVKKGDSLFTIAQRFNVSVSRIKEVNKLKGNAIQSGRVLKIPYDKAEALSEERSNSDKSSAKNAEKAIVGKTMTAKDAAELGVDKHIVTKGENLSAIARKYNMELATLIQINQLNGEESLTPGQVLSIK